MYGGQALIAMPDRYELVLGRTTHDRPARVTKSHYSRTLQLQVAPDVPKLSFNPALRQ